MSLETPTPMPDTSTWPDSAESDLEKILTIRWQDNREGHWSKLKQISLGKQGQSSLLRKLCPMGVYKSRQFELVMSDNAPFTISSIEDVNGVLG